jgi:choline dehydrogenase-like flavoprotein
MTRPSTTYHPDRRYDVVIVGAGVVGAVIAKVIAESAYRDRKAVSINLLEAGGAGGLSEGSHLAYLDSYYRASIKTPNAPYLDSPSAPSPEDIPAFRPPSERYFRQTGKNPFGSNNTRALGGTTLHWMGIALRMIPADFKMQRLYGRGVDWPISYQDLRPYYEMAEWELGVSASRVRQAAAPGSTPDDFGLYEYPMQEIPPSHSDRVLMGRIGNYTHNLGGEVLPVRFLPIPQARNADPTPGAQDPRAYLDGSRRFTPFRPYGAPEDPVTGPGQRCEGNASCIPICPARAKYTALKTLQQLRDLSRLPGITIDISSRSVVADVQVDASGTVTHLNYIQYDDDRLPYGERRRALGRRFILAASAIENVKILLASRNSMFPNGLANRSDQLGRNLMDHPFVLAWGLADGKDELGTFRGPGATSDLPMRDGMFRINHAAFRTDVSNWGWGLAENAPATDLEQLLSSSGNKPAVFGAALRQELRNVVQRQVTFGFLMEQLPCADNRVTIDDRWRDQLGLHKPVIHYEIDDYTLAGIAAAYRLARDVFRHASIEDHTNPDSLLGAPLKYKEERFRYIGAGHIMGTHRMGSGPRNSVVDSFQLAWEHPNLVVAGCGSMPTAGTSNPTLTAVALGIRSAEKLFNDLDLAQR